MKINPLSLILLMSVLLNVAPTTYSVAQSKVTQIKCGDIVEAELTKDNFELKFLMQVSPGTLLSGRVEPVGDTLNLQVGIVDANNAILFGSNKTKAGQPELFEVKTSASNSILIVSADKDAQRTYDRYDGFYSGALGAFAIYLGCTLRDGTVIKPGDSVTPGGNKNPPKAITNGFGGLAGVDFTDAITVSLQPSGSDGKLPANGNTVLGYTFSGKSGSATTLTFTRKSGNLNLGLVVLSSDNKVVYQASLVNTTTMSATFVLPSDGEYTIGVFKIDLLPPAAPEATSFQIQVKSL
jgi:hypothetical protein